MLLTILGTYGTDPDLSIKTERKAQKVPLSILFKNKKYLYFLLISAIFYGATIMANTYVPAMFINDGMEVGFASTLLSIAVICETPLVLFSYKFMDKVSNKKLLIIAYTMVCIQFAVYGLNLCLPLKVAATFVAKHPAGMLYIMINLKVIHTIVDEHQIITALAFVATVKNLVSIFSQNIAGMLLDIISYSSVFLIFFVILLAGFILTLFFKVNDGNGQKLFN